MWNFSQLQYLVEVNGIYQWIAVTALCAFACGFIDIFLFTHLFKIEVKKSKKIMVWILDSILRTIVAVLAKPPIYRASEIIITIILFRIFLEKRMEKCICGETINAITIICAETIVSKFLCIFFRDINTYIDIIYSYKYKFCLVISIAIIRTLICLIVKYKKFQINIGENLTSSSKNTIIVISIIGSTLIYMKTIQMTMYITNIPYSFFVINLVSLIIYFYISMKDIVRITKIEEQDLKINNLESYNKTLQIMYDNIRGFRHDYSNFLQALNGYVHANNIEGIKLMCKSATKECMDVNKMGILDPTVINNPAVYSLLTNKYFLAQEEGIDINIEVMIDLKEMEICNYELCKILAILLDNAIEAARECREKVVNIRFVKDNRVNRKLLIIENSYSEKDIDLDKIFEKGYTSKEDTESMHGLGLWNVRRILKSSSNLNLFTSKGELFSQQLEIYEKCEVA